MDKGAHFYRTDFQIHTPRDSGWTGCKPITAEERLAFARTFVAKCRELGIQVVGITDHHDICFIKYFQVAAQEQEGISGGVDWHNIIVEPERQNPIIFPGVEVTLQLPCQCIILLDAVSDPTIQAELLQAIRVGNTHSDGERNGPQVNPISLTLPQLDKQIRDYASGRLIGKYIILPHVGDGGHKTLIRTGFNCHYAQMPCVGGYIEKNWDDHTKKHLLDGRDPNYGNKTIGIRTKLELGMKVS